MYKVTVTQATCVPHINKEHCAAGTHCQHVITFHVWQLSIFTLVVKLPEEVEGYHRVEVHHHRQQADRQHQLKDKEGREEAVASATDDFVSTPTKL